MATDVSTERTVEIGIVQLWLTQLHYGHPVERQVMDLYIFAII